MRKEGGGGEEEGMEGKNVNSRRVIGNGGYPSLAAPSIRRFFLSVRSKYGVPCGGTCMASDWGGKKEKVFFFSFLFFNL